LILSATHQLLVYADDINILGGSIHTIRKKHRSLIIARKERKVSIWPCLEIGMQDKMGTYR
jgi:hypothetical protein